jgi:hypothetical protein
MAFASSVLPVPGGPKNKIPYFGLKFSSKRCGYFLGYSIVFMILVFVSLSPPISSQSIFLIEGVSIES